MALKHRHQRLSSREKGLLLDLCRDIIAINSTNPHGTLKLAEFLSEKLAALGFRTRLQRARFAGAPQANLIARKGPQRGRPLVLNTHLDTVTTDPQAWSKTGGDPFRATLQKGRLYGLGSADTKLALACQWVALHSLREVKWMRPLILTGTYGEEMGLVGVRQLLRSSRFKGGDVLNSEPTGLRISDGNKGFRIFKILGKERDRKSADGILYELHFRGKAAHSGTPHLGINACQQALRWLRDHENFFGVISMHGGLAPNIVAPFCRLQLLGEKGRLRDLRKFGGRVLGESLGEKVVYHPKAGEFLSELSRHLEKKLPKGESQNLGLMEYHGGIFQVWLDHRFPPLSHPDQLWESHQAFLLALSVAKKSTYVITKEKDNPAFRQTGKSPWVREVERVLKGMGRSLEKEFKPGCTEAGYFAERGCHVLTFGPGLAYGNAHQPNESVEIKDLEAATIFYRRLLERFCEGG